MCLDKKKDGESHVFCPRGGGLVHEKEKRFCKQTQSHFQDNILKHLETMTFVHDYIHWFV